MLVLSRYINESIMVGDAVKLTVIGVEGGKVKIGIDAPRDVSIHRLEVFHRQLEEHGRVTPGGGGGVRPAVRVGGAVPGGPAVRGGVRAVRGGRV